MTLVGPRPEVPKYVAMYTTEQRTVLELVPGITDKASIAYADESALLADATDPERFYLERVMPEKIKALAQYAARATPFTRPRNCVRNRWTYVVTAPFWTPNAEGFFAALSEPQKLTSVRPPQSYAAPSCSVRDYAPPSAKPLW